MILAAAAGDLEGAQPVAEAGAVDQRPAALEAEQHRAAEGVAAAGRIDDLGRRDAGDDRLLALLPDLAALRAERDDDAAQVRARHRLDRAAGALGEHLRLVVVDGDPGRAVDEGAQLLAVEHRQALAGIEDERHAGVGELARMVEHGAASVGRDDRDADVGARRHGGLVRPLHRAGMERRDLVVVEVGDDEGLRREGLGDLADVLGGRSPRAQPRQVVAAVGADGGDDDRLAAERGEVVGDVAGAAAELAPQASAPGTTRSARAAGSA